MYLKSIEVHGFKSFANKIILEFHDGITGIVGPNGSGKSNVADAVRWVLGEQSAKQLRGARMEDIIFSGTQTRKPLGYAYVAITMDNSDHKLPIDFDEVTVARRVYRSGESEYLINGTSCRLRDVQELFLDTGIGKEGYSIIGQGQIDKILSGKPEDRRELFDEAAGIVKFKRRKHAAEKNLAEEKLNLSRITDIIKEIENQLAPLEKQSQVAKVYLKLKEDLKTLDINQFRKEYDRLNDGKTQVDDKLTIVTKELEQGKLDYDSTKEEYIRLEKQLEEWDLVIEEHKLSYNNHLLQNEKAEGEIKVLKEQISSVLQNDEYLRKRVQNYEKDMDAKKEEESNYLADKVSIDEKITQLGEKLNQVNRAWLSHKENIQNHTKEIEACNNAIFEYLNKNAGIKGSVQRYETMLEQNTIRRSELNQRLLKIKTEECIYTEAIEAYEAKMREINDGIHNTRLEGHQVEEDIKICQQKIDQLSAEYNHKHSQMIGAKSRYDSLINLTERYDGYGNSIKKVMEQKVRYPGILGVVADIIKVEKTYETAVETALGGTIQNIVTEDEATAKAMIDHLKHNKFGRATFLPLTNISAGSGIHNQKVLDEKGVIGIASTLVEVEPKYRTLIDYLMGKVIVVDHIDHATALGKKYNHTLRIVTLEGELLTPGGSISGGAYKNASNLLGRRREIEELEEESVRLQRETEELTSDKEIYRENKNKLREQLEEIKGKLQELFLAQNTNKMSLDQENAQREEARKVYEEFTKELTEIELQANDLKVNLEELNQSLSENINHNTEKESHIESLHQALEEERTLEQGISDEHQTLKMELSSLEQSNQYMQENMRRVRSELKRLTEEQSQINEEMAKASHLVKEKEEAILSTQHMIKTCGDEIQRLEATIKKAQSEREDITAKHKNFFGKREELSIHINQLDKESYRLTTQKDKLQEQEDLLMNYMWEEYELTFSSVSEYTVDEDLALPQIKKMIGDLKSKIKELGDVNVNSIEDFKNLSQRYEFLTTQREDLIKAEEVLLDIIEELDREMRIQFEEKFTAINEQFDIVFKELFGGGKADLELTEGEDILEAGIRINGQPPGKKLQNMMQLSGGEKALTAISLLFAIQNLKPSPFCLLDEIEAALDDSNVKRFANYLHKLTSHTQFIIITHRRGTMGAADVLYGITMQEKGVSTLVSVNLIENELDK